MSNLSNGQNELSILLRSTGARKPILYVICSEAKREPLAEYTEELTELIQFELVQLDPVADYDLVYTLRRAARRLLQGPDQFPLYLFATSDGFPFYCVTNPTLRDAGHQIGLETHCQRILDALQEEPETISTRALQLREGLLAQKAKSAALHGDLIKRAAELWQQSPTTVAQALALSRIEAIYPELAPNADDIWEPALSNLNLESRFTQTSLSTLKCIPKRQHHRIDLKSWVSKLESQLQLHLEHRSSSDHSEILFVATALHNLAPSNPSIQNAITTVTSEVDFNEERHFTVRDYANLFTLQESIPPEFLAKTVTSFHERLSCNTSTFHSTIPIQELDESYQEGWDTEIPDAFMDACYALSELDQAAHPKLVSLLDFHGESIKTEPQFYPTALSVFARVFKQSADTLSALSSRPSIPGSAEIESLKRQINEFGFDCRSWPGTTLVSAPMAMGTLRLPPETSNILLEDAWSKGVRVFDIGGNYSGGLAEEYFGRFLHELHREEPNCRSEMILVGRVGQISPSLQSEWQRKSEVDAFKETSITHSGSTLCLHPEWIRKSLEHSLQTVGIQCMDVALVSQPELFLLDARDRNARFRDILDSEISNLLVGAFKELEQQCKQGKIKYYGVVSNTFGNHADGVEHLSPKLILDAAQEAGGVHHRCRVMQFPLNLLERGILDWQNASSKVDDPISVAEFLQESNISMLGHRPLNAAQGQKLHRFATLPEEKEAPELSAALAQLKDVEATLRESFDLPIRLGEQELSLANMFHFADELEEAVPELGGLAEWEHLEQTMIAPRMKRLLQFMDQLPDPEEARAFAVIRPTWIECYEGCRDATREVMLGKSRDIAATFAEAYRALVPQEYRDNPSAAALSMVIDLEAMSAVVCGPTAKGEFHDWPSLMKRSPRADAKDKFDLFDERVRALLANAQT